MPNTDEKMTMEIAIMITLIIRFRSSFKCSIKNISPGAIYDRIILYIFKKYKSFKNYKGNILKS